MATLINLSDLNISIVGTRDGKQYRFRLPPSVDGKRSTVEMPDADADHWTKRTKWLKTGKVMLKKAPSTTRSKPKAKPSDTPTETATSAADTVPNGTLDGLHWKTALAAVAECTDLDELATMHETEARPRVVDAIEKRMEELRE